MFTRFLRAHTLWVGFTAVFVPLMLLLALQYVWLGRLAEASAIAHQSALRNYLESVATEVEYFYRSAAERTLNVPSSPFSQGTPDEVALHWKKRSLTGIRRLFVVDYTRVPTGNFYVYDPDNHKLMPSPASEESLAIVIACLPWQTRVVEAQPIEETGLQVNELDPANRIILSPVTDEQSMIVGVVAMVLDEEHFTGKFLPAVIEKNLPSFFPQQERGKMQVVVQDQKNRPVLGGAASGEVRPAVSLRIPFVFTDWTLGLRSLGSTPEQLARESFVFNMTLTLLLAVVLIGGVVLALRTANRAIRLSEMKSDFVSNVSHELRTPLASIRVFAEFLRLGRASTPEKVLEYGEYIEVESHRLSRLISNILDFSRIESGRKTYQFVSTDLSDLIGTVMKSFAVRLTQSGFKVETSLPDDPLPQVNLDADAIGQALHNLLDNAAKYSQDEKHVKVELYREGNQVVIAVKDKGMGIAKDEQQRIFERFHRVGTGLVHDIKGSGLGLSIVHHIVLAHGGSVSVESEPGQGSTFFVRLPVK
jgi:signal transduction histidine kinase